MLAPAVVDELDPPVGNELREPGLLLCRRLLVPPNLQERHLIPDESALGVCLEGRHDAIKNTGHVDSCKRVDSLQPTDIGMRMW